MNPRIHRYLELTAQFFEEKDEVKKQEILQEANRALALMSAEDKREMQILVRRHIGLDV